MSRSTIVCRKCGSLCTENDFPVRKERKTLSPHNPCYECRRKREAARRQSVRIARLQPATQEASR